MIKGPTSSSNFVLLALLVSICLGYGCQQDEVQDKSFPRPAKAIRVSNELKLGEDWFPGRAKAHQEVDLSFRVSGPIISRPINVGSQVKQGDLIARIDPRDFQVNLRNMQGRLDRAKAAVTRARSDYRRIARIMKQDPGAASQTMLDQTREAFDAAKAELRSLEAGVDTAKDQLKYTYLRAPFDGTIVATYAESFEDVRAKQRIARLLDTSRIEMIVNIPENRIHLAPHVKNIVVKFDAFPDEVVPATIYEIGTEASATTRTFPVTIIMNQPDSFEILPGMAGKTTGEARPPNAVRGQEGFTVPVSAVFAPEDLEKTYVWVIQEETMTVQRREVTTGLLVNHGIVITEGLNVDELVVTAGVHSLQEGQAVTLLEDAMEPGG